MADVLGTLLTSSTTRGVTDMLDITTLTITALAPGDTATVAEVFAGLSDDSRYLRFHCGMPRLTAGALHYLAAVRPGRHQVVVARLRGRPVGLARWVRIADQPSTAELAVEVVDAVHGQGVGRLLLDAALASARRAGIEVAVASVLRSNDRVRRWAARAGAVAGAEPEVLVLPLDDLRIAEERAA